MPVYIRPVRNKTDIASKLTLSAFCKQFYADKYQRCIRLRQRQPVWLSYLPLIGRSAPDGSTDGETLMLTGPAKLSAASGIMLKYGTAAAVVENTLCVAWWLGGMWWVKTAGAGGGGDLATDHSSTSDTPPPTTSDIIGTTPQHTQTRVRQNYSTLLELLVPVITDIYRCLWWHNHSHGTPPVLLTSHILQHSSALTQPSSTPTLQRRWLGTQFIS